MPALAYWWDGFCSVLVPPSPNVQSQLVGLPVDWSVKLTVRGAQPELGVALKAATGLGLTTTAVLLELLQPLAAVTVKV